MTGRQYSDRIYATLLWEFMQHASRHVWDSAFVDRTVEMLVQAGTLTESEARSMLTRSDVPTVLPVGAANLFMGFLMENPAVLAGPDELLTWVESRQADYPL